MTEIILCCLASLIAGFIDAIGGGGGMIVFPTLLMLGLPVNIVAGTNKFVQVFGTGAAAFTFFKKKAVVKEIIIKGLPFTCLGAGLGAFLVLQINNEFLKPLVSIIIFVLALYIALRKNLGAENNYAGLTHKLTVILCFGCFAIGFYDGFMGPGTGMFLTYMMVKYFKLDFVRATGNAKVFNLASNIVPICYFLTQGNIRFDIAAPMACANILGGILGAHSAIKGGPKLVRWISIIMALVLALKLARDYL